ncbi:TRAP transporter small permease [Blautia pseudococcoides]|uniref:TRAP transporter small permease n=1 Tax=Blautia pseudococcoides TaxID=1796616 RepID=UPI00148B22A3|nr:TRAP transporter small permease subunit [Blautia pseudococcoides]QJU17119.1 TRAP transporter small permease [Blautia pseudococcoides]
MKSLAKILEKINSITLLIEKWLLIAMVVFMVSINFIQVLSRYIFRYSIPWSEQTSVVLFMFMILIGGNLAIKEDSEIRIEIIKFKNQRSNTRFRLISDVISLLTLGLLFVSAIFLTIQGRTVPQSLSAIPLSYWQLYMVMVIGFGLMFIEKLTNVVKKIVFITDKSGEVVS